MLRRVVSVCLANVWLVWANDCSLNDVLLRDNTDLFDLSHKFDNQSIYWPNAKPFEFTKKIGIVKQDNSWYAANEFEAGEHGGTHIDAPFHFYRQGKFVGDLELERLIVPLIIVDISSLVNGDPNFVLYKQHLDYMMNTNDGKPCMIIFKYGWSKFYGDRSKYLGINERDGTLNFPGLSKEVADWIISYKNIVGVGVDTASMDPGSSTDFLVHKTLYGAGLYGMENIKLDDTVPEHGCTGIALPMKIAKGTGGPLRLVAICPKKTHPDFFFNPQCTYIDNINNFSFDRESISDKRWRTYPFNKTIYLKREFIFSLKKKYEIFFRQNENCLFII